MSQRFPEPDAAALAVSTELVDRLREVIVEAGGWIGFDTFMRMALYEPGLGYYSNAATKFGLGGDFTTAPELGDWLARAIVDWFGRSAAMEPFSILELGAGSGRLAEQLVTGFDERGQELEYAILETSAELRGRQQQRLGRWGNRVRWLDRLPESPITGIVLANEVADALPVARFEKRGTQVLPLGVGLDQEQLALETGPEDSRLSAAVADIEDKLGKPFANGYRSEVCLTLAPWIEALCASVDRGGILLIDYGLPRREYYRADRTDGTLICHYRHRAHTDPLLWPGLQDITAWVDFSAVTEAARRAGFTLAGYTTQAHFLLETLAREPHLSVGEMSPAAVSALKTLTLPGEMGERFKLIWLTRNLGTDGLPGRDFRNRL